MPQFTLPNLTESHCISCNCLSWRTVCLACERGDNGPAALPNDRTLNREPFWMFGGMDDLQCDTVDDIVCDALCEMLGLSR